MVYNWLSVFVYAFIRVDKLSTFVDRIKNVTLDGRFLGSVLFVNWHVIFLYLYPSDQRRREKNAAN